jgi:hypothetical protein
VAQGGELPVANTNGFDYREVAFQFTETLTERDYDFPVNAWLTPLPPKLIWSKRTLPGLARLIRHKPGNSG